jgi:two-component system, OmpR family, sensor histidine kinase ChvG
MPSKPSMELDIDSAKNDDADLALTWSRGWTLAHRILAVNVLTLALVLLAILYLDSYRNRLEKERVQKVAAEANMAAIALQSVRPDAHETLLASLSKQNDSRIRLYGPDGQLELDSWRQTGPSYRLRDPATQKWNKDVARALDRGFNALVGEESDEDFVEPAVDRAQSWKEVVTSRLFSRRACCWRIDIAGHGQ